MTQAKADGGPSDPSPTALPGWVENALDRSPATRREILRTGELASQFGWTDTSPTAPAPDVREALYKAIYEANGCTLNDGEAVRRAIDITIAARPSIPPVADLEAIIKELQSAKDAFGEIRLDWSDPRDKCREGSAAINRAIALLHPQPAKGERP